MDSNWPVKAQTIRVLDVALIGPLMIWGGLATRKTYPVAGTVLAAFGVSTIIYNAVNYGQIAERKRRQARASQVLAHAEEQLAPFSPGPRLP